MGAWHKKSVPPDPPKKRGRPRKVVAGPTCDHCHQPLGSFHTCRNDNCARRGYVQQQVCPGRYANEL